MTTHSLLAPRLKNSRAIIYSPLGLHCMFRPQTRRGRATLNPCLSSQFCDSRLGWISSGINNVVQSSFKCWELNYKLSGYHHSVVSYEYISMFQLGLVIVLLACHSYALNSVWPLSELSIREVQRPAVFLSTLLTLHTFFNRLWKFVTDSFPATSNSRTARCFKLMSSSYAILKTPAHAQEEHFSAALQEQEEHSKLITEKITDIFCWFWLKYRKCRKAFWRALLIRRLFIYKN